MNVNNHYNDVDDGGGGCTSSKNKYSCILLEDKQIFGLNRVHKNVLQAQQESFSQNSKVKSKVYAKSSYETDDMLIDPKILNFVSDGLSFDKQVVKSKAAHSLPYSVKYVKEIFENKANISDDYVIDLNKRSQLKYGRISSAVRKRFKQQKKQSAAKLAVIVSETPDGQFEIVTNALVRFKPKSLFHSISNESLTDSNVNIINKGLSRSLDHLEEQNEQEQEQVEITPIFLTESKQLKENKQNPKQNDDDEFSQLSEQHNLNNENRKKAIPSTPDKIKSLDEVNWDDHLISLLSENTARWIVLKSTFDTKQKKKLNEMVEKKYGRFTRDVQDLELIEYDLSEYEKRKIAEEKQRLAMSNKKIEANQNQNQDLDQESEGSITKRITPIYRLPIGLKREALNRSNQPDSSHNKTAQNLFIQSAYIEPAKTYDQRMLSEYKSSVTTKTLFQTDNPYQMELLETNVKHKFMGKNETKIELNNGKQFEKSLQSVFPLEFTNWISGVAADSKPIDLNKKPVRGKKRWTKLPLMIDNNEIINPAERESKLDNYWNLMPPTTTDNQLRKIAKSNLTVARIVDEWRKRWQTSNRWTIAQIDELINDMKHPQANIRFQAVVVCSRAVEQIQIFINKLKKYHEIFPSKQSINADHSNSNNSSASEKEEDGEFNEKSATTFNTFSTKKSSSSIFNKKMKKKNKKYVSPFNYDTSDDTDNLVFSANLFETILSLLNDSNQKVKLAAAIAIFIILRQFKRPMNEKIQISKNNAEKVLRDILSLKQNNADKYTAAQCLSIDGICEEEILGVLFKNYFESTEQYTKEQVTKTLSELSTDHELVSKLIEQYLSSDHARERILAAKLLPCMRRSISKQATNKLIHLMWNDLNANVKKVAAQTLGRTGRGRQVHDEINRRLESSAMFDRLEALKKINFIGIITNRMLSVYLKCFKDDHISVREMACKSAQRLWEKPDKLIDAILFMAQYDQVNKLKALAIQTLGLIGEYKQEIRKCILWALQFETDPLVRTEACHTLILLTSTKRSSLQKDNQIIDILQERHLIEQEPLVKNELMTTLIHMGYNPNRELPIVTKVKSDVARFNDKQLIINKLKQIEKQLMFEFDKERFIWQPPSPSTAATTATSKKPISMISEEEIMEKSIQKILKTAPPSFQKFRAKLNKLKQQKQQQQQQQQQQQFLSSGSDSANTANVATVQPSNPAFLSKLVE